MGNLRNSMKKFLNKLFGKKTPEPRPEPKSKKSAKDLATERGQPYVNIVSMELNPEQITQGAFELEWNSLFVAELIKLGFRGRTDEQIVDQWFTHVCRNIALETLEQELADPEKRLMFTRRDLGDGRVEVS